MAAVERLSVRPATEGDADILGELVGGVYISEGWSPESARTRMADGKWVMQQGTALVAVRGETVLGAVIVALPGDQGRQIAKKDEAEFRLLAVSPEARGAGAGEALVRAVIETAAERGFGNVVLSTQEGMAAAQRLYTRLGFLRAPGRDWARGSGVKMLVFVRER